MKELSIEQKARRYDEAIEKLRNLHDDYDTVSTLIDVKEELEHIFPELKESEDERIRKALKEYFINSFQNNGVAAICGVHIKDILAWLERQCEKGINGNERENPFSEQILANSAKTCKDGQKPAENKGMNLVEEEMTPFQKKVFCIIDTTVEEEHGLKQVCDELFALASNEIKQNYAWSEDDEKKAMWLVRLISTAGFRELDNDKMPCSRSELLDWLKSLRPQNKYAYNPYKAVVESIAAMVEKYAPFDSNLQDFYDNVKVKCNDAKEYDSLYPQSTWKPSDEQMKALCFVKKAKILDPEERESLNSLYIHLRKLK